MKVTTTLHTSRLVLRPLLTTDADEIYALRTDPIINKYLNRQPCQNLEDALRFIESIRNNSSTYWGISFAGNTKLIGTICLFDIVEGNTAETGFELLSDYQNQGIMKEAANKVIEYAALTFRLKSVVACTHHQNESSIHLLKALKFEERENPEHKDLSLFQLNIDPDKYMRILPG